MSRVGVNDDGSERRRLLDADSSEEDEESSSGDIQRPPTPADRCFFVYCVFFLIGIGSLLPWNFFSNAKQYFLYKLRNVSISDPRSYTDASVYTMDQRMFETYLALASQIPSVLFVFINMVLTKIISTQSRIAFSISLMILLFIPTICLTQLDTDYWQHSFLILSLVTAILMNAGSAVLQGAICGLASMFPHNYMQSVFSGMGFGGLTASLFNLATIALGPDPGSSGLAFFLVAELILIVCLILYFVAFSAPFAKFYTIRGSNMAAVSGIHIVENSDTDVRSPGSLIPPIINTFRTIVNVAQKIWIPALSIFYVFFVSLACYPAVLSAIQSNHPVGTWATKYFTPVICFVIFNLTDFLGRNLAGVIQRPRNASPIFLIACMLRGLFIPLFLLCNVQPRPHQVPISFKNDAVPIVLNCLFGLSNGYMGTLSMMHAPRLVPEHDVEMAGSMMACFLSLGLAVGAAFSAYLVNAI